MVTQIPPDFWRHCALLFADNRLEEFTKYVGGLDAQISTCISCEKAVDFVIPRVIAKAVAGKSPAELRDVVVKLKQLVEAKETGEASPLLQSVAVVNYMKAIASITGEKRKVLGLIANFLASEWTTNGDALPRQQPVVYPLVYLLMATRYPQKQEGEKQQTIDRHISSYDKRFLTLLQTMVEIQDSVKARDFGTAMTQIEKITKLQQQSKSLLDVVGKVMTVYVSVCSTLVTGRQQVELNQAIHNAIAACQDTEVCNIDTTDQEYNDFVVREKGIMLEEMKNILDGIVSFHNALELLMGRPITKYKLDTHNTDDTGGVGSAEQCGSSQNMIEDMMNGIVNIENQIQQDENVTTQYSRILVNLFILLHKSLADKSNPNLTLFAQHLVAALGASSICPISPLNCSGSVLRRARTGVALATQINMAKHRDPGVPINPLTSFRAINLLHSIEEAPGLDAVPESLNNTLLSLGMNTIVITNHRANPNMNMNPLNIFYASVASYRLGEYEQAAIGFAKARSMGHRMGNVLCSDGHERSLDAVCLEWEALACLKSGHLRTCAVCVELLSEEDMVVHAKLDESVGCFSRLATRLSQIV